MSEKNKKYVLIQTKVSSDTCNRLDRICKDYRFASRYDMMQHLISAFLRHADPESEEIGEADIMPIELAKVFEELQNKSQRINTAAPSAVKGMELVESIQLYRRNGHHGFIASRYTFKDGDLSKTSNNGKILSSVIRKLFPGMHKKLSSLCTSLGDAEANNAISYLLDKADHELIKDNITREIQKEFKQSSEDKHSLCGDKPKGTRSKDIQSI